jgi:2,4-dienoyl-CoA reductase-like NADH-dependent reductase (Old Yellow Enzyme family)
MTRLRVEPDESPSDMMIDYYRQRASAGGLLITAGFHHTLTREPIGIIVCTGLFKQIEREADHGDSR